MVMLMRDLIKGISFSQGPVFFAISGEWAEVSKTEALSYLEGLEVKGVNLIRVFRDENTQATFLPEVAL